MRIKKRILQKFVSVLSSALLLLNSFSPYLLVIPVLNPSPVGAQVEVSPTADPTATPSEVSTPTPAETVTIEPSPSPTVEVSPTEVVTPEPTATPTVDTTITPTADVSPTVDVTPVETIAPTEVPTLAPVEATSVTSPPQDTTPAPGLSTEPSPTPTPSPTIEPVMTPNINGIVETTLVESYECRADSLNGCLVTDKADYAPTDIAIITGHAFAPNTQYTLRVTSSDAPAVDSSYTIATDETGSFTYSYQLDGNYRPNYLVELKDSFGFVVATVSFTDDAGKIQSAFSVNPNSGTTSTSYSSSVTWNDNDKDDDKGDPECSGSESNNYRFKIIDGGTYSSGEWVPGTGTILISENITCANSGNSEGQINFDGTGSSEKHDGGIINRNFNLTSTGNHNVCFVLIDATHTGDSDNKSSCQLVNVTTSLPWPTDWTTPNSCVSDPAGDESPSSTDLIGTSPTPSAVGFASDANYQYFRERLDGNPANSGGFDQFAWVVLFQTTGTQYQYLLSVNGVDEKVQLYQNTSPAGAVDFSPLLNDPAETLLWEGNTSTYARITTGGDGKKYVEWAIPLTELTSRGITSSTTKFFATSANANNYNKDHLKCYESFADLEVIKSDSPDPITNGGVLTYTLAIHNYGPDTAYGVVVTDTLPAGYAVTSVTPSTGSCSDITAPSLSCELGDMANGANATVTIVGTLTGTGTVTNNTSVTLDTTKSIDLNLSNNNDSEDTTINPNLGHIIINKNTVGGDGTFNFSITGTTSSSSAITTVSGTGTSGSIDVTPGSGYQVTETVPDGWVMTSDCEDPFTVSLNATVTCTFTNTKKPKLTVTKIVTNNNGGTKVVSDFPLYVGATQVTSGATNYFDAGTYLVSETGYAGYDAKFGGDCNVVTGSVTLAAGDDKACTITNDDKPGTLIVKKVLTQDDGGAKAAIGFSFKVNDGTSTPFEADGQNDQTVDAGTYTVVEDSTTNVGYSTTYNNCTNVVIPNGGTQTCTITNNDIAPQLTLVKEVVNDDGGLATSSAWSLSATEADPTLPNTSFFGFGPTVGPQNIKANKEYVLSESAGSSGYSASAWVCTGGTVTTGAFTKITLGLGENVTCTITNNDIAPTLTVNKILSPVGHGAFDLMIDGTVYATNVGNGGTTGAQILAAGVHSISEQAGNPSTNIGDYIITYGGDCDSDGNITLALDDDKVCTITNTAYGSLTIIKDSVPNDPQDFSFTTTGTGLSNFSLDDDSDPTLSSTKVFTSLVPGNYRVSETAVDGWDLTNTTCSDGSTVDEINIGDGENVTCTFTNTKRGSISGYKYNDADGSDSTKNDRTPIANWTIQLYKWVTDAYNYVTETLTDVLGLFTFSNLVPGQYEVREVVPTAGWTPVLPTGIPVTLGAGDEKKDNNFANFENATIIVHKNVVKPDGTSEVADTTVFKSLLNGSNSKDIAEGTNATYSDLTPGTYTITEDTLPTGYALVSITDDDPSTPEGQVAVSSGKTNNVYIVNKQLTATLVLVKNLPNDNGGTAVASDFKVYINDVESTWGSHDVDPGSYTVKEDSKTGYTASDWSNGCSSSGSVTLKPGESKTCEITNDDQAGSITITKNAVPNAGRDFNFTSSNPAIPSFTLDDDGNSTYPNTRTFTGLSRGTYVITEGADNRWNLTNIVCVDPDNGTTRSISNRRANIDLDLGENITCTFTNRRRPQLTVIKHVINDNNGTLSADDFTINVTGQSPSDSSFPGDEGGTLVILNPGEYSVDETEVIAYAKTLSTDCSGSLAYGNQKTCTITNDDKPGTLIVKKHVINDNGGDKEASEFTMSVTGTNVSDSSFPGDEDGTTVTLDAGSYSVDEAKTNGYARSDSNDCSGTIANGETKTCTITNDDIAPKLTLIKKVTNDNGGTAGVNEFGLTINGDPVNSGETKVLTSNNSYPIDEVGLPGYSFVSISGDEACPSELGGDVTLYPGDDITCTITNDDDLAHLIIKKHVVNDNGGTKIASDFTMSVTGDNVSTTSFAGDEAGTEVTLDAGSYSVSESGPVGYADSYSEDCNGTIANGETKTCTVTNDDQFGTVTVTKFNDLNGNGKQDQGEPTLPDWKIKLSGNGTQDTNVNGVATFNPVMPGNYNLDEIMQKGWKQTVISCSQREEPTPTPTPTGTDEEPTPTPTPTSEEEGNICHWNEGADKWNALSVPITNNGHDDHELDFEYGGNVDSNGHPVHDAHTEDPALDGDLWCEENDPRLLTQNIFGIGQVEAATTDDEISGYQLTVHAEENVECIIGNQQINPTLQISKSNDGFNRSQGDSVIYTLKIKALDSNVLGVKVKDLLPKGFSFQNVISIIRNGVDDITSLVGDPAYHSPGTYNLGDMNQDDEIIIKYKAKIGDSQKFGIYKDVAWAEGTSEAENKVLALAQPEGKVSENFVGTSVKVDGTISEQGSVNVSKEEGQVLGASTSLPATGANRIWIFIALLLSVIGAISVAVGLMFKKGKFSIMKNLFINTLFTVILFSVVNSVSAASNMTIRLSEPKTPTKENNFTIDFVTLDLTNSGLDITVKCFYKKNLADAWTQYGPDIIVAAPGNSGSCQEVSSIVTSTQTTYFFKATASNGAGSDDTELQGLVSVGYDNRDPSAPTNYVKEKISSCQYKISFKTADDGMTTRVEVYRSENTTMALDGSTKAGEVSVGPNTSSSFTDTVPDCSKTYYYVIRAFNVQGNSSAAIGDSVTITSSTTSTTTTTTGEAIPVTNVTLPAGGTGGGSVLGEETKKEGSKESQKKEEIINVGEKKGLGTVLGTITKKENRNFLIIASILGLVIIAYGIYLYKKKRQNPQI